MDSEKSLNSYEMKSCIGYLIIHEKIVNFINLLITFQCYYFLQFL